ncbi:serine/threonine protein kinase [Actinomadura barringtoniae]|uniref:Serine/threonine protein kinase n=1 Tax=Actinomadura barringtoniae TaxID=1427535 RepID=A0A939PFE9_9ACTN|nr:serine/threonine-protein kinase [Actinomadura barringtoniae]MBO2451680.1 serine/threonine protein kinase [Actinomadura barringtoniae]
MPEATPLRPDDPAQLGPYRLTGRLGMGGQGVVYLGRNADGTPVAVKVLREEIAADPRVQERFIKEIAAARRVDPFCIAQVLDASLDGPRPYIVTEYVEGPSLQEAGARNGATLQRLAVATATALAAIHQAGVVHRDFKPSNVLLGPDGPRVIDFGIARDTESPLTLTSSIIGTPAYMAPEQFEGDVVGPPADVFAWASVMAFAASGLPPYGADSFPAIMKRVLTGEPDLRGLHEPLRSIVAGCLVKDPAQRPTMETVLLSLLGSPSATGPQTNAAQAAAAAAGIQAAAMPPMPGPPPPAPPPPAPPTDPQPAQAVPAANQQPAPPTAPPTIPPAPMVTSLDGAPRPGRQGRQQPAPGQRKILVLGLGGIGVLIAAAAAVALLFTFLPGGGSGSRNNGGNGAMGLRNGEEGAGANGQGSAGSNQANGQSGKPNPNGSGSPSPGSSQSPGASGSPKPHGKSGGAPDDRGGDGGGDGSSPPKSGGGGSGSGTTAYISSFTLSSQGKKGDCYYRYDDGVGKRAGIDANYSITASKTTQLKIAIYDDDYALYLGPDATPTAKPSYSSGFGRVISEPGYHTFKVVLSSPSHDVKTVRFKVCDNY